VGGKNWRKRPKGMRNLRKKVARGGDFDAHKKGTRSVTAAKCKQLRNAAAVGKGNGGQGKKGMAEPGQKLNGGVGEKGGKGESLRNWVVTGVLRPLR